ncbi:MAG: nucleotidyltransferase domain-containing protein [Thermoplasmata archaeon]|nr:nucleotidyltransferase domain-containing protein [Thermoplasmata archaeon]
MEIANVLADHSEIVLAYLFGSIARGEAGKHSDVDIGILLSYNFKPDRFYEVKIAEEIEKKSGIKNVEVTILNDKKLSFLNQVLRYGKILFSRDEMARINFETTITKKYIDLKPYFEEYNRMRRFYDR